MATAVGRRNRLRNGEANKLSQEDRPAHDWFRFVLSYPPHLVPDYLERFGIGDNQRGTIPVLRNRHDPC